MAVFVRTKRVTDPLNEKLKACLCGEDYRKTGYVSSGSEHDADDSSTFLSDLINGFLDDDAGIGPSPSENPEDSDPSDLDPTDTLQGLLNPMGKDKFRSKLFSHVSKAVDEFSELRSSRSAFRRAVMTCLKDSGYNAGICKTKWQSSGGLTGGSYEFVDVVRSKGGKLQRYLIDLDFAGEFEIARPTGQYERVLRILPRIYVGQVDELKRVVRVVADAAKRSLQSRDLHLPPWRKNRYMQAKWLGPYKRTVGQIPTTVTVSVDFEKFSVKCRSIGFDAVRDSSFVLPAATRTR